jgi:hypothetical protein
VDPVRVKVYGVFPMTRRRYLAQLGFAAVFLVVVLAGWWALWPRMEQRLQDVTLPPAPAAAVAVLRRVPWILLAAAALQAVEAAFVLRRFRAKGAAAAAPPPAPPPT